jgi:hypothetical protein
MAGSSWLSTLMCRRRKSTPRLVSESPTALILIGLLECQGQMPHKLLRLNLNLAGTFHIQLFATNNYSFLTGKDKMCEGYCPEQSNPAFQIHQTRQYKQATLAQ